MYVYLFIHHSLYIVIFVVKECSVLIFACEHIKNPQIIELLVKSGAKINTKDKKGKTAFDYALRNLHLKSSNVIDYLKL